MEDLLPITETEQASFCVELTKRLNMQRKQGHLCDLTLVTKEGKELMAHSNVLSAVSPFFHKLLQSDMKESHERIVRLEEISGSVMEDVLNFTYTGTVEVTEENAEELIVVANYLLISSLKVISGRFLGQIMNHSNCISTFYLAEKYHCDELFTESKNFIQENFASVAFMDEFLSLESNEVERWLSNDEITVKVEADVFEIIEKWIKRNRSERIADLEKLFRLVRLDFLSRDYLIDVVTNELIQENPICLKMGLEALKKTTFSDEGDQQQSPRKGVETSAIVACGGKYTFCYLPEKDQWKRLTDSLSHKYGNLKVIRFRGQLYAFPSGFGKAESFNPVLNGWSKLDLSSNRASVVAIRGEMYAIEVETSPEQTIVKRYNVESCIWETRLSSLEGCRTEACIVAAGSHLYVLGGSPPSSSQNVAKAERFDTVENKWEEIVDMQEERGNSFGVAIHEKIFVAGGSHREKKSVLQTCEVYDISTNEWYLTGSLIISRKGGSMVCLNKKLFVLGGENDRNEAERMIEFFNPEEGKWIQKTTIPVERIARGKRDTFTGCVLKLSKGVLDKLKVIEPY